MDNAVMDGIASERFALGAWLGRGDDVGDVLSRDDRRMVQGGRKAAAMRPAMVATLGQFGQYLIADSADCGWAAIGERGVDLRGVRACV